MPNGVTPGAVANLATPAEPAPPVEPLLTEPHERRRQSQKQLAQLDEVAQMLAGLSTADGVFQAAMTGAGLLDEYLTECNARYTAAEQAVEAPHPALVEAPKAAESLADANVQAPAGYRGLRQGGGTGVTRTLGAMACP